MSGNDFRNGNIFISEAVMNATIVQMCFKLHDHLLLIQIFAKSPPQTDHFILIIIHNSNLNDKI